jgi:hypothetical protein
MNAAAHRSPAGRIAFVIVVLGGGVGAYLLFSYLSNRQAEDDLFYACRSLAFNAILVGAALAAGRIPGLFLEPLSEEKYRPAILAASYALAGFGAWRGLQAFAIPEPVLAQTGIILFILGGAWALTHLAVYAQRREWGGIFSGLIHWLVNTRSLFLLIVAATAAYAVIIRPGFIGSSTYSVLLEWIVIITFGIIILGVARFRIGRLFTSDEDVPAAIWPRHRQQVTERADPEFTRLRNLGRQFVSDGDSALLVRYLISLLAQNGVREPDIAGILRPLIETHIAAKSAKAGKDERAALLTNTVTAINNAVQPACYAVRTAPGASPARHGAERTLTEMAKDFIAEGTRIPLVVRLTRMLEDSGTRTEDIEEILTPLLIYIGKPNNVRRAREILWQEIVERAGFYAPKLALRSD